MSGTSGSIILSIEGTEHRIAVGRAPRDAPGRYVLVDPAEGDLYDDDEYALLKTASERLKRILRERRASERHVALAHR
jgi:hypothetical protein